VKSHIDQAVDSVLQREVAAQAGRSMFSRDGRLRHDLEQNVGGNIHLGEYLQLGEIPYGKEPYGSEHATNLARLCEYMASLSEKLGGVVGGPLGREDQKILYAVAILYSVGRANGEENYAERSAAYADKYFRSGAASNTYWSKEHIRDEVCRLILKNDDRRAIAEDKRLQVFSDAKRYEMTRLYPNTAEGLKILREWCSPDQFYSGFAKDKSNLRAWMIKRGWR
jgi:hypothetical protein